jgi:hypothetical protein
VIDFNRNTLCSRSCIEIIGLQKGNWTTSNRTVVVYNDECGKYV